MKTHTKQNITHQKQRLIKREIVRTKHFVDEKWSGEFVPELLNTQKESFKSFLDPKGIHQYSLERIFQSAFPMTDGNDKIKIEYINYVLEKPQFSPEECKNRGATYASKLILKLRITVKVNTENINEKAQEMKFVEKNLTDVTREESFFVGYLPLQTDTCTFIINGNERYVVAQLKRCAGPLLCKEYMDVDKIHSSYIAKIIPHRGSWLEFYTAPNKDYIEIRIDRKKKILFTTFLMCFPDKDDKEGSLDTFYTKEKILRSFYPTTKIEYLAAAQQLKISVIPSLLINKIFSSDLNDEKGDVVFSAKTLIDKNNEFFKTSTKYLYTHVDNISNFIAVKDIFDEKTGEIYLEAGDNFSTFFVDFLKKQKTNSFYEVLCVSDEKEDNLVLNTVKQETNNNRQEALASWAKLMKHSEYVKILGFNHYFHTSYLSHKLYDMSLIGRRRCIQKFRGGLLSKEEIDEYLNSTTTHLMGLDIINMVQNLIAMYRKEIFEDNPDSYINRRIRAVGELLGVQVSLGLERVIKKLQSKNVFTDATLLSGDFFNAKTILYPLHEFLNISPLSQYASQENILSKLRHANKLSVFGPGGISGSTVATAMRDINPTQMSLICPVETPEGPHVGLVTNLALAAKIDPDGFLMAPFYVVKDGLMTKEIIWLNAFELSKKVMISKSAFVLDEKGQLVLKEKFLLCRHQNTYKLFNVAEVDVTEVSPSQMFSISTAHLPNPQYGDGYRASMGAAMNGQAVVLLHLEAPLTGTGMEKHSAIGSGETIIAKQDGIVRMVDSRIIVVEGVNEKNNVPTINLYEMKKFERSNQDTCMNQRPLVKIGDIVQKDSILADGYSTYKGELALGRNLKVMYLPFNGYCFEDAMVMNEDAVNSEKCASLHIYSLEVKAQDTRYGTEEITRDLPGIRGDEITQLDENGIIRLGAKVKPGDYLVGKITPEGEKKADPQKRLLQAIFVNKANLHKKTPLIVPPSIPAGSVVTDIKIFTKSGIEMSGSALVNLQKQLDIKKNTFIHSNNILLDFLREKFYQLIAGHKITNSVSGVSELKKETLINENIMSHIMSLSLEQIKNIVTNKTVDSKTAILIQGIEEQMQVLETQYQQQLKDLSTEHKFSDDTTLQMIKIFITSISKTEVGDKLASRYGNKGVISKVANRIDMPYLEDGTIVDLIMGPLGMLARMNISQLYEILTNVFSEKMRSCVNKLLNQYLKFNNNITFKELQKAIVDAAGGEKIGFFFINESEELTINDLTEQETIQLAHKLTEGIYSLVPPFESISLERIQDLLEKYKLPSDGKVKAFSGVTSEPLEGAVIVGLQFMMQLVHKVQQKIHARSTGAYLRQTGQPTNGKQRGGGQKIGEMENWAQAAHGTAFICKETNIKSDDAKARKEFFIRQCSNNISSLLTAHIKKEINTLNRLDKQIGSSEEDLVEASFALVKEELFACGFKMLQKKIVHVEESCLEHEKDGEDDFIISANLSIEELEATNLREKINLYRKDSLPQYEKVVFFTLTSPQDILTSSNGEVLKTETINYRTNLPEKNGLLCEEIFGPVNNYECACKKYSQKKYFRIKCEKCGVTVLHSDSRRFRRGHITLAYPMIHPFYLRPTNNKICLLLDISYKDLIAIRSLEKYIIVDPGLSKLNYKQMMSKEEAEKLSLKTFEFNLVIETGAKALRMLLEKIDFPTFNTELKAKISKSNSDFTKKHYRQVLSIAHKLSLNKIRPEWMILQHISVLPANLRQIVEIAPNEFASSDLNALYREVIGRNNRLKTLIELEITDTVIENEIRMLQESVNALFGGTVSMKGNSKYKSLAEFLQGKHGRFRQNLLGKRVDYSARSVIVVGPRLKLNQCGVPRDILIILLQPYLYFLLKRYGIANTYQDAKRILEDPHANPKIWDLVAEAVRYAPYILANRAPTLHKLSILSFEIVMTSSKAIELHPLVCSAFNADFDGDQMALHLLLSIEAQLEASILMSANKNILSTTNGQIVIGPRQDITIGLYALTVLYNNMSHRKNPLIFYNVHEVQQALLFKVVHARENIKFFIHNKLYDTTIGRVLLWEAMPKHSAITFDLINKPVTDKVANELLRIVRKNLGDPATVELAENFKTLGFEYAEKFGISIGLNDFPQVDIVHKLKKEAENKQIEYELQYMDGLITFQDKEKKMYQLWTQVIHTIREELEKAIKKAETNSVSLSIQSGARGSFIQIMQIIGLKGFISHVDGSVSNFVIKGNYLHGLTGQEFFDAQAAARTVAANSSLKTAYAGYATRKLVDGAHGITVNIKDCYTPEGITVCYTLRNGQIQSTLSEQILGRVLSEDIVNPLNGEVIFSKNYFVKDDDLPIIDKLGIIKCKIRSPITCISRHGVCSKCYGSDLSTGELVVLGEPVGIVAAQSIAEPGTQLTLKSKAFGGVAQHDITATSITSAFKGTIKYSKIKTLDIKGKNTVFSRGGKILIMNDVGHEIIEYVIPYGAILLAKNGVKIEAGEVMAEWDLQQPILSEYNGICRYENILDKITCDVFFDESIGQFYKIIKSDLNTKNNLIPVLVIYSKDNPQEELTRYAMEEHTIIQVEDGEEVFIGTKLGKLQNRILEKVDIVGGLPKVSAMLENRQPKIPAILAPFSGFVEIKKDTRGRAKIQITNEKNKDEIVEFTPTSKNHRFVVHTGEFVDKGDELTIGTPLLNDVLHIKGVDEFFKYFLNSIKMIYEEQGIFIKNIHFEVIASKLLSKVMITENGDSDEYVIGEVVEYYDVVDSNKTLKNPIKYRQIFMGLTATALNTPSILSAMSFQGTTLVLADSIIKSNKVSKLGFKEELILGELLSIGTGRVVKQLLNTIIYSMEKFNEYKNYQAQEPNAAPINNMDALEFYNNIVEDDKNSQPSV